MDNDTSPYSELPSPRVVAFLDILGSKSLLSSIFKEQDLSRYATLRKALSLVSGHAASASFGLILPATARGTGFSDCLAISDEPTEIGSTNVAWRVALLSAWLLEDGILCRGGIAIGRTLHTETCIVGEGLVSAYELESSVAVYPRIVLSEEVAAFAAAWPPLARSRRDVDGLAFLDPFYMLKTAPNPADFPSSLQQPAQWDLPRFQRIAEHLNRLVAESRQAGPSRIGVLAKQQWLLSKLSVAAQEYLGSSLEELLAGR